MKISHKVVAQTLFAWGLVVGHALPVQATKGNLKHAQTAQDPPYIERAIVYAGAMWPFYLVGGHFGHHAAAVSVEMDGVTLTAADFQYLDEATIAIYRSLEALPVDDQGQCRLVVVTAGRRSQPFVFSTVEEVDGADPFPSPGAPNPSNSSSAAAANAYAHPSDPAGFDRDQAAPYPASAMPIREEDNLAAHFAPGRLPVRIENQSEHAYDLIISNATIQMLLRTTGPLGDAITEVRSGQPVRLETNAVVSLAAALERPFWHADFSLARAGTHAPGEAFVWFNTVVDQNDKLSILFKMGNPGGLQLGNDRRSLLIPSGGARQGGPAIPSRGVDVSAAVPVAVVAQAQAQASQAIPVQPADPLGRKPKRARQPAAGKQVASLERHRKAAKPEPLALSSAKVAKAAAGKTSARHAARTGKATKRKSHDGQKRFDPAARVHLINWFKAHLEEPNPDGPTRQQLAAETGLTKEQVQMWFVNTRKRFLFRHPTDPTQNRWQNLSKRKPQAPASKKKQAGHLRSLDGFPAPVNQLFLDWARAHILNPYPDAAQKEIFQQKTGLVRGQVTHWFINFRHRHWVEEGRRLGIDVTRIKADLEQALAGTPSEPIAAAASSAAAAASPTSEAARPYGTRNRKQPSSSDRKPAVKQEQEDSDGEYVPSDEDAASANEDEDLDAEMENEDEESDGLEGSGEDEEEEEEEG